MNTNSYSLPKSERISRKSIIDKLFAKGGQSFVVYPLRVVYITSVGEQDAESAILISVSKKRFKRAVKRNYIKRRIKEAYRLNKHKLILPPGITNISIAFLYLSTDLKSFETINKKMVELIEQLNQKLCSENS